VLKELGFNVVAAKESDIIVDDQGKAAKEDITAGKSYIGIGGKALDFVKNSALLPGFDYRKTDFGHEGLLRTQVAQDSLKTAPYEQQELLYTASGSWITAVPSGAKILASVHHTNDYYKTGWWPGHDAVKGKPLAIADQIGDSSVTLFANDLVWRAHPQHSYRMLANTIFASALGEKSFADTVGHWAEEEVRVLAAKQVVMGTERAAFSPEESVTRAQFAALLARALKLEEKAMEGTFSDVAASAWYAKSVEAAARAGIVQGAGGVFEPEAKMTREAMATMIVRALEYGGDVLIAGEVVFADKEQLSAWSAEAVAKAVNKGLIHGVTESAFAPQEDATRAQSAVLLYRLLKELQQ
jgi:hypothetical protein